MSTFSSSSFYDRRRLFLTRRQTDFETPIVMYLVGPQGSGKTSILAELLIRHEEYFDRPFSFINVQFLYHQPLYERIKSELGNLVNFTFGFRPGLVFDDVDEKKKNDRLTGPKLLVYDDQDSNVFSSYELLQIVKGGAHHTSTSIIIVSQSFYHSGREKKYATEMFKQAQVLILNRLFKERYAIRQLAVQLNWSVPFLINAYAKVIDRFSNFSTPNHFVLYFSHSTPEFLRCRGNVIKKKYFEPGTDLRIRFTWIFIPSNESPPNFNSTTASAPNFIDASSNLSSTNNDFVSSSAMTGIMASELSNRTEPASVYFLLNESEMNYLISSRRRNEKRKGERGLISTETRLSIGDSNSASKRKKTMTTTTKNDGWFDVLDEELPSMISYPVVVRERALRLGRFLRRKGIEIVNDRLRFPRLEERRRRTDGEGGGGGEGYFLVDRPTDVLLFFSSPDVAGAVRPRELFALCNYFLLSKTPKTLFHVQKSPNLLLKSLRQFYTNKKNLRL